MHSKLFKRGYASNTVMTREHVAKALDTVKQLNTFFMQAEAPFETIKWASSVEKDFKRFLARNTDLVPEGIISSMNRVASLQSKLADKIEEVDDSDESFLVDFGVEDEDMVESDLIEEALSEPEEDQDEESIYLSSLMLDIQKLKASFSSLKEGKEGEELGSLDDICSALDSVVHHIMDILEEATPAKTMEEAEEQMEGEGPELDEEDGEGEKENEDDEFEGEDKEAASKTASSELIGGDSPKPKTDRWSNFSTEALTEMIKTLSGTSDFDTDKESQRAVSEMSLILSEREVAVEEAGKTSSKLAQNLNLVAADDAQTPTDWNAEFHGEEFWGEIPDEAAEDIGQSGDNEREVYYWMEKLDFNIDREKSITYLASTGGWTDEELDETDDATLSARCLWIIGHNQAEEKTYQESHSEELDKESSAKACELKESCDVKDKKATKRKSLISSLCIAKTES